MESSTQTAAAKPASAAKGESGRDNVAWRATSTGRSVALVSIDLIPGRPLRLWGAAVEISDGGVFVRLAILGPFDGWSVSQLLAVALARFEAELAHSDEAVVAEIVSHLDRAVAVHREPQDGWAARREVRAALALEVERVRARWAAHVADCDEEPELG